MMNAQNEPQKSLYRIAEPQDGHFTTKLVLPVQDVPPATLSQFVLAHLGFLEGIEFSPSTLPALQPAPVSNVLVFNAETKRPLIIE